MATPVNNYNAPAVHGNSRLAVFIDRTIQNPRWMLMKSISRFGLVRSVVRRSSRRPSLQEFRLEDSKFTGVDPDAFVDTLLRDGFCTGLRLPEAATQRIVEFAENAYCYGDAKPAYGFRYRDKLLAQEKSGEVFSLGTYLFPDEIKPTLNAVAHDPLLMLIAAKYLNAKPVMTGTRVWWTFAAGEANYNPSVTTSFFHYDKDDYAAVRLFFYLTPVDDKHGPHAVVRGSHMNKQLSQLISLGERTDEEIVSRYGQDKLVMIYGKPGEGFAEDPFCFHKATRPVAGDRLMLEIKYATYNYNIFSSPNKESSKLIMQTVAGQ